ncbi:MAG: T9SS type A sorting domain-containing protein, partial [Bacteroidales bacterium]|nr:T9SS type A sorting domain-containing protein [Bacteroidales bacterium]
CDPASRGVTYYVNGIKDTTCFAPKAFENCTGGFRIGAHKNNKDYWKGRIDELYLFKGILSPSTIMSIKENAFFTTDLLNTQTRQAATVQLKYANNEIIVSCTNVIKSAKLYDMNGKRLNCKYKNNKLSVLGLAKGTYLVKVIDAYNYVVSEKVLVR